MDIMPAFEAVVGGSNPSGCTKRDVLVIRNICPLNISFYKIEYKYFIKNVDNYVSNVYKGHSINLSFKNQILKMC